MGTIKPPTQADGTIAWAKLEITIITKEAERPASMEERRPIIRGHVIALRRRISTTARRWRAEASSTATASPTFSNA